MGGATDVSALSFLQKYPGVGLKKVAISSSCHLMIGNTVTSCITDITPEQLNYINVQCLHSAQCRPVAQ
jgi:hypothetical protein